MAWKGMTLTGILVLCAAVKADAQTPFHWQQAMKAGQTLEIKGVNGDIRAVAASEEEAVVHGVKRGRARDFPKVRIDVVEHDGGVTICAVYPSRRRNVCEPGSRGMSSERVNVTVAFDVQVPRGVRLIARTVNGSVDASGLDADAEAHTVNGGVSLVTLGQAEASSVNGAVRVSMGRTTWDGELELSTVNGSVQVSLPADADLNLSATTTNGEIETDFPVTVEGRVSPRRLQGTIGDGGRMLALETVNGSIRIIQGP